MVDEALEQRNELAVALEILTGWQPSLREVELAKRTGEIVTQHGYKLLWSESLGWVVQLPLDFPEIWALTRLPSCSTDSEQPSGSTAMQTLMLSLRESRRR